MMSSHETCQQYITRRISEGWRIVDQRGFQVILQSPEGILRPVDIRNDVDTLRPNAVGDYTTLTPSGAATNWECVDEAVADEDSTCVIAVSDTDQHKDAYNLSAHSGSGTINSVTVYFRFRSIASASYQQVWAQPFLRLATVETAGTDIESNTDQAYHTHSEALARPGGGSWSWDDIDALQACIGLRNESAGREGRCTQVYVEVDYTPAVAAGRSFGFVIG